MAIAGPLALFLGRDQWFTTDDWYFLAQRDLGSLDDLLRPHNQHWTTVPVVIYRLVFKVVGINHFVVYQAISVASHLAIVVLLRPILLRVGVRPWIATVALVPFAVFGAGANNITVAFQVTLTGGLAVGLGHLLLVDHEGPADRRDLAGLLLGVVALAWSGIGLPMAVAAVTVVLLRRGLRAAFVHGLPLAVVYGAWHLAYHPPSPPFTGVAATLRFAWFALVDTWIGFAGWTALGLVLGAVTVAGTAWFLARTEPPVRGRVALLAGCGAGLGSFVLMTGATRAAFQGVGIGTTPQRYIHVVAALVLPFVALGASTLVRRWPRVAVPIAALLLVGVPGNVRDLAPRHEELLFLGDPEHVVALAAAAEEVGTPADVPVDPATLRGATAGWLVEQRRAGRIPSGPVSTAAADRARLLVSIESVVGRPDPSTCTVVDTTGRVVVDQGEVLLVAGDRVGLVEWHDGDRSPRVGVTASWRNDGDDGRVVVVRAHRRLVLHVDPAQAGADTSVCR